MKSEEELARFMDNALREHANRVLNGQIQPYKRLLDGQTTLNLTMTIEGSSISIKDADAPPPPAPEPELEPEVVPEEEEKMPRVRRVPKRGSDL